MDYQSRLVECLKAKDRSEATRNMDYESCLNECVLEAKSSADTYKSYPKPSAELWKGCVDEALFLRRNETNAFSCIGRYEIRLAKLGLDTVSAQLAESLVFEACCNNIPVLFLVASAINNSLPFEFHHEPFLLVPQEDKDLLLVDLQSECAKARKDRANAANKERLSSH